MPIPPPSPPRSAREPCRGRGSPLENPCSIPFLPAIPLCAGTHNRVEYIMPCTFRSYVLPTSIERRLAITRANVMRSHTLDLSRSFPLSTTTARCVSYYSTSALLRSPSLSLSLSLCHHPCACAEGQRERERESAHVCTSRLIDSRNRKLGRT